jgi:hypothetical protein
MDIAFGDQAEAIIKNIEEHDPVLLEAIREWGQQKEAELGGRALVSELFFAGAMLCYSTLNSLARSQKKTLPSFTAMKQKPVSPTDKEYHRAVDTMCEDHPEVMEVCGTVGMMLGTLSGVGELILPQGGSGAVFAVGGVYTYAAIYSLEPKGRETK